MSNRSQGRKKSNFPAETTVLSGAFFDYFANGVNTKISFPDFLAALGVTGTIVQNGAVAATPVLDVQGSVNAVRNLEDGSGVKASVSPKNGITLDHNFLLGAGGVKLSDDFTLKQPVFRSFVAGSGINISGAGDLIQIALSGVPASSKTVIINVLGDFPAAVANVITLEPDTIYFINNDINSGADRFVLQEDTVIQGGNSSVIALTYTGTDPMFSAVDANCKIIDVSLSCANSNLLNMTDSTGLKAFQLIQSVVVACDKLGVIDGLFGFLFRNVTFASITTTGLLVLNNLAVIAISQILVVLSNGTFLDLGTAIVDQVSIETTINTLLPGTTFLSGLVDSGNIPVGGLGVMLNNRFSGGGAPLNNISPNDALWNFSTNDDIADTRPDGLLSMQANAVNTVITTQSVPVLVLGAWVVERTSQMSGTVAGRITYEGGKDSILPITASLTIAPVSGGSQTLSASVALNGVEIPNSMRTIDASASSPVNISITWQLNFSPDDFIEIFVANESGTTDILVSSAVCRVN